MTIADIVGCRVPESTGGNSDELVNSGVCVGIECELEDARPDYVSGWIIVDEGSLRGRYGKEYIFRRPYNGEHIIKALEVLERAFDTSPNCSKDASVHVHLDVSSLEPEQVDRFIAASVVFEPLLLTAFCADRINNPFCQNTLSNREMADRMASVIGSGYRRTMSARYASINLDSIRRFGSVEFRSHPAAYRKEEILRWVNALLNVYTFALTLTDAPHRSLKTQSSRAIISQVFPVNGSLPEWAEGMLSQSGAVDSLLNTGMCNSRRLWRNSEQARRDEQQYASSRTSRAEVWGDEPGAEVHQPSLTPEDRVNMSLEEAHRVINERINRTMTASEVASRWASSTAGRPRSDLLDAVGYSSEYLNRTEDD